MRRALLLAGLKWCLEFLKLFNHSITYKIIDLNGEEIEGSFYQKELRKTKQDIFKIEKIIRQQGNKSLVKWFGYNDSFNSWVDNKAIVEKL